MAKENDDFAPVSGGVDLTDEHVRDDLEALCDVVVESDLDQHIVRLLTLHSEICVAFRNQDLTAMSDSDKRLLLQDINDLLGIKSPDCLQK